MIMPSFCMESTDVAAYLSQRLREHLQLENGVALDEQLAFCVNAGTQDTDPYAYAHALDELALRTANALLFRNIDPASVLADVVLKPHETRLELRGYLQPRHGVALLQTTGAVGDMRRLAISG